MLVLWRNDAGTSIKNGILRLQELSPLVDDAYPILNK